MYFVNAQGLPAYNEKAVFRTLEKVYQVGRKLDRFIDELEKRYFVGGDQNDRPSLSRRVFRVNGMRRTSVNTSTEKMRLRVAAGTSNTAIAGFRKWIEPERFSITTNRREPEPKT